MLPYVDPRVFITNGHGRAVVEGAKKYFYLIARDVDGLEIANRNFADGKSGLYVIAAKAGQALAFSVIDIAGGELEKNLAFSDEGKLLYKRISDVEPCLVTSPSNLVDPTKLSSVNIFPLRNFDQDFHEFQVEMRLISLGDRTALINAMRDVNRIIKLRPAIPIIGLGVDVNELFSAYLDRLEKG